MRLPRRTFASVAAGALVSAATVLAVTVVNSPVASADPPEPPFNLFALDGGRGSFVVTGSHVFDTTVEPSSNGEFVQFVGPDPTGPYVAGFLPPTDSEWTPNTTYVVGSQSTSAQVTITGGSRGCPFYSGSLTVYEVARDGDGDVDAFAAIFAVNCGSDPDEMRGEVRWNSSRDYRAVASDASAFDFGSVPLTTVSEPTSVTFTAKGSVPVTFGLAEIVGTNPDDFFIYDNVCFEAVLSYGKTCSVWVAATPVATGLRTATLRVPDDTPSGFKYVELKVVGEPAPNQGTFYGVQPQRILDTREGIGGPRAKLGAGAERQLVVAGRGLVPASGVSAVVLNVTVTNATGASFLTVYPSGVARPLASSLNFVSGWTGANMVTVGLGSNGAVRIYNHFGTVDVIADVIGYYAADGSMVAAQGPGSHYNPLIPGRVFDSREDPGSRIRGGRFVLVPFTVDETWDPHITAVAANVTAVDGVGAGFFTTWDGVGSPPLASTLNYAPGAVVPNMALIPVSWCDACDGTTGDGKGYPAIGVYTNVSAHVIVDIMGVYDDAVLGEGLRFTPLAPQRIADSRVGQGLPRSLGPLMTRTITPPSSIVRTGTYGLAMNITAVTPTAASFVSVWPSGVSRPLVSNLNTAPGQTLPNSVYTLLGPVDDAFNVYNHAGSTHLLADVVGTFYYLPEVQTLASGGGSRYPGHPDATARPVGANIGAA